MAVCFLGDFELPPHNLIEPPSVTTSAVMFRKQIMDSKKTQCYIHSYLSIWISAMLL